MELSERRILYEDADLLAVDKPSGLPSHATVDPDRDHLVAALERLLRARDGAVGHLGQHHRLDRGTSGIVLFSRDSAVDRAIGEAFARRRVDKRYDALVRSLGEIPIDGSWLTLRSFLAPGRGFGGKTAVVRSGGQPACTEVRRVRSHEGLHWVEARPHTGRTHQIRVQLAHAGAPILGDATYGVDEPDVKRLMLHAARVELSHPRSGAQLRIGAASPRAFTRRFPSAST